MSSSSSETLSPPPRHSVTSSPVISRWTPPGHVPSAWWTAKKPSISAMIWPKSRVLRPPACRKTLPCIGSQTQTGGHSLRGVREGVSGRGPDVDWGGGRVAHVGAGRLHERGRAPDLRRDLLVGAALG